MAKKQKPINFYENYRKLCEIEWRIKEIGDITRPLLAERKSLMQKRLLFVAKKQDFNGE